MTRSEIIKKNALKYKKNFSVALKRALKGDRDLSKLHKFTEKVGDKDEKDRRSRRL